MTVRPRFAIVALLCVCALPLCGQQTEASLRDTRLGMIFSSSLFHAVNQNDASVAVRVWATTLGRRRGFKVQPSVDITDDTAEIRRRVLAGTVSVVALDAAEYLKLGDISILEPMYSALRGPDPGQQRLMLLIRSDSGATSLEGLRGKSIIIHANTRANLGQTWLDATLQTSRLEPSRRFFRSVEVVSKPTAAVLPVFFGKTDAAIVQESDFSVIREMNPQVGTTLRALVSSPPFAEAIICVSRHHDFLQDLVEEIRDLHKSAEGRQILLVFRFSRMVPMDRKALEQVREWVRRAGAAVPISANRDDAAPATHSGGTR